MYLGYIPPELSAIDKYLMSALLAAGKTALTKRLMLQTGPTIDNCIDVTTDIYSMEKVIFFSQPKVRRIHDTLGKMGTIHQTSQGLKLVKLKERPLFICFLSFWVSQCISVM